MKKGLKDINILQIYNTDIEILKKSSSFLLHLLKYLLKENTRKKGIKIT